MGELLNKVFLIFVRPTYFNESGIPRTVYKQPLVRTRYDEDNNLVDDILKTNNASSTLLSTLNDFNTNEEFLQDPWFLIFSTGSYDDFKLELKSVLRYYGLGDVKCGVFVPTDIEVIPNE